MCYGLNVWLPSILRGQNPKIIVLGGGGALGGALIMRVEPNEWN